MDSALPVLKKKREYVNLQATSWATFLVNRLPKNEVLPKNDTPYKTDHFENAYITHFAKSVEKP